MALLLKKAYYIGLMAAAIPITTWSSPAQAFSLLADSATDFSVEADWLYGTYSRGITTDNYKNVFEAVTPENGVWKTDFGEFTATGGIFYSSDEAKPLVRRWVSPFTGEIHITGTLPISEDGLEGDIFNRQILHNGLPRLSQDDLTDSGGSIFRIQEISVKKGDVIDFIATSDQQNFLNSSVLGYEFTSQIHIPSGLFFFIDDSPEKIRKNRVGLLSNDNFYESNAILKDVILKSVSDFFVDIKNDEKSYLHFAEDEASYQYIKIPELIAAPMANTAISSLENLSFFQDLSTDGTLPTAEQEKCSDNSDGSNKFGCTPVGFIEWLVESVGWPENTKEGFISNDLETEGGVFEPISSILDVNLLHTEVEDKFKNKFWTEGWFDAYEFIYKAPDGKRFGYTDNDGFFNSIPDLVFWYETLNIAPLSGLVAPSAEFEDLTIQTDFEESRLIAPLVNIDANGNTLTNAGEIAPSNLDSEKFCGHSPNPNPGLLETFRVQFLQTSRLNTDEPYKLEILSDDNAQFVLNEGVTGLVEVCQPSPEPNPTPNPTPTPTPNPIPPTPTPTPTPTPPPTPNPNPNPDPDPTPDPDPDPQDIPETDSIFGMLVFAAGASLSLRKSLKSKR